MGNVKLNALLEGVSGKVGSNLVLRKRGKRTILATNGERTGVLTEKQKVVRERFKNAATYAKSALRNPEIKAVYEAAAKGDEFMTAFTVAVRDYLRPPQIAAILLEGYTGQPGSIIQVRPIDDFKIVRINVSINAPDGTLLETGDAVQQDGEMDYQYAAVQANAVLAGTKVTVKAIDRPGNETIEERVL
ncbi:hypothetical protein [Chryseolinea sp. H1M3-3]|uniref:hypothetical protein n=1 Tax=Chryseolinea sp. H1M3-3 TaxID=3034144 RepID=UPI0023EA8A72|nr:hypothetical protein [Chryseolinea sp. H1M3-3]